MDSRSQWIDLVTLLDRRTQEGKLQWKSVSDKNSINFEGAKTSANIYVLESKDNNNKPVTYILLEMQREADFLQPVFTVSGGAVSANTYVSATSAHVYRGAILVMKSGALAEHTSFIAVPFVPGIEQLLQTVQRQFVDVSAAISGLKAG